LAYNPLIDKSSASVSAFGQPRVIASMLPLLLSIHFELVTVLDYPQYLHKAAV